MVRTTLSSNPTGKWIKSNQDPRTSTPKINKTMKIKLYSQGMDITSNNSYHIPETILHHPLLAKMVYRI